MTNMRTFSKLTLAASLTVVVTALFTGCCGDNGKIKPTKNVILMIPDGTSSTMLPVVRWYKEFKNPQMGAARLATDPYLCGYVRPACSDAPIAASPAAITSLMTGYRVQNSNLSVYPAKNEGQDVYEVNADSTWQPLATVLEAAKILGHKSTGLVVTVKVSHATPAGTASHVVARTEDANIMRQIASNGVDVVFGGGIKYMDDDVKSILEDKGIKYQEKDMAGFRALDSAPVWSMFAKSAMAYDIDRDTLAEPSLAEMTTKAIELLSKNKNGFFLMVEGSKVDFAAHSNDPLGTISEYEAFDKAVAAAIDFAKKDGNTTVIVVPDHGTAGMTLGDRNYSGYYKKGLDSVFVMLPHYKGTGDALNKKLEKCKPEEVKSIFLENTGIDLNEKELKAILAVRGLVEDDYMKVQFSDNLKSVVMDILNAHTHIGYSNGSHTSEDVFLAVYNPNNQRPTGFLESTEMAGYIFDLLGVPGSLKELTSNIYVKSDVLLAGHECVVEPGKEPVLVVDGKVRVPANRSYVEKDGKKIQLSSVSVYVPKNKTFYISKEVLGLL